MYTAPIAVINQSTVLTDKQITAAALNAFQIQVTSHFAPVYNVNASLKFYPKGITPPATSWQAVIFDNSDQADALAYHELTNNGLPLAKIFAKTEMDNGYSWTVSFTHELLEMLADPWCTLASQDPNTNLFYAYEVCDPVEDDQYGYLINKILVSDFIWPSWFDPYPLAHRFDQMNHLSKPLQIISGGYAQVLNPAQGSGWQQVTADIPKASRRFALRQTGPKKRSRHP